MIVSTFEVLFKRLFPDPANAVSFDRRVVQGYFLSITNLEPKDYTYSIEFHASPPAPGLAAPDDRRPNGGNCVVFFDTAGDNQAASVVNYGPPNVYGPGIGAAFGGNGFSTFTIPAKSTGLVLFFPNPQKFTNFTTANPPLEVRGHVVLRLPALRRRPFRYVAQSDKPVRVLLNPETRATFFPDAASGVTYSQTHSAMQVSTGKGENLLEPDPGFFLDVVIKDLPKLADRFPFIVGERFIPDAVKLSGLLDLMNEGEAGTGAAALKAMIAAEGGKGGKKGK